MTCFSALPLSSCCIAIPSVVPYVLAGSTVENFGNCFWILWLCVRSCRTVPSIEDLMLQSVVLFEEEQEEQDPDDVEQS